MDLTLKKEVLQNYPYSPHHLVSQSMFNASGKICTRPIQSSPPCQSEVCTMLQERSVQDLYSPTTLSVRVCTTLRERSVQDLYSPHHLVSHEYVQCFRKDLYKTYIVPTTLSVRVCTTLQERSVQDLYSPTTLSVRVCTTLQERSVQDLYSPHHLVSQSMYNASGKICTRPIQFPPPCQSEYVQWLQVKSVQDLYSPTTLSVRVCTTLQERSVQDLYSPHHLVSQSMYNASGKICTRPIQSPPPCQSEYVQRFRKDLYNTYIVPTTLSVRVCTTLQVKSVQDLYSPHHLVSQSIYNASGKICTIPIQSLPPCQSEYVQCFRKDLYKTYSPHHLVSQSMYNASGKICTRPIYSLPPCQSEYVQRFRKDLYNTYIVPTTLSVRVCTTLQVKSVQDLYSPTTLSVRVCTTLQERSVQDLYSLTTLSVRVCTTLQERSVQYLYSPHHLVSQSMYNASGKICTIPIQSPPPCQSEYVQRFRKDLYKTYILPTTLSVRVCTTLRERSVQDLYSLTTLSVRVCTMLQERSVQYLYSPHHLVSQSMYNASGKICTRPIQSPPPCQSEYVQRFGKDLYNTYIVPTTLSVRVCTTLRERSVQDLYSPHHLVSQSMYNASGKICTRPIYSLPPCQSEYVQRFRKDLYKTYIVPPPCQSEYVQRFR